MAPINQVLCVGAIFAGMAGAYTVGWIFFAVALVAEVGFGLLAMNGDDDTPPPPSGGGKINW